MSIHAIYASLCNITISAITVRANNRHILKINFTDLVNHEVLKNQAYIIVIILVISSSGIQYIHILPKTKYRKYL
jgi:hypothetical protein